ncbi:HpyAIV family type II restriction enzyme [Mycoplasmopsis columbinasalis]|uniref:Uncharacterized protein n=1 Tax=Mycoplasmopsis columbinasalis TaxID=114880 RepID=A0A449BB19_9BACT|nr:hypothetical protein [Mycoplasmopsis columbinasalis]VEU78399.1 Uncharacterised protein [Mycoplasmopsis columbinasalis]
MNFNDFSNEIKYRLTTNRGPRMLEKLIEAPDRFFNVLTPLNFKIKLEQSFLRTQENVYFKYLCELAINFFIGVKKFLALENRPQIVVIDTAPDGTHNAYEFKFNFHMAFGDEQGKTIYYVIRKKRDSLSKTEADEFIKHILDYQSKLYKIDVVNDNKVELLIWFVDSETKRNKEFFENTTAQPEFIGKNIKFFYGGELFEYFQDNDYWLNISNFLKEFHSQNHDYFLTLPNLDSDRETLEYLVRLSEQKWNKFNSVEPIYVLMRKHIFDQTNAKSNYLKAVKMRHELLKYDDSNPEKDELIKMILIRDQEQESEQ